MIKSRRVKINSEVIISDFKKIHRNTYDYSKVIYKTMHTKVDIICNQHGVFKQTPNAHIRQKQGCPKCGVIKNSKKGSMPNILRMITITYMLIKMKDSFN